MTKDVLPIIGTIYQDTLVDGSRSLENGELKLFLGHLQSDTSYLLFLSIPAIANSNYFEVIVNQIQVIFIFIGDVFTVTVG